MDKTTIENLIQNCNADNLAGLFRQKTRNFSVKRESLPDYNDEHFTDCTLVGDFRTYDDQLDMLVFMARVGNELSERSGKKLQYELGKKILKNTMRYAGGFFVFYDDRGSFRFSLIYDIPLPSGKRQFSNFRRYTYFVSREQTNKTFIQQISEADFSSLPKIIEAFSVDKVRKQFYTEIATWYFWSLDKIKFPDDYKYASDPAKDAEIRNSTNLIRLITRIIFIWFLKEKKLIPGELFDAEALKNIVKDFYKGPQASNYYNAILQNLFFGTLNQQMDAREFANDGSFLENRKEYEVKTLYRYADKFNISKDEAKALFKDIPFLNGGLFDCLDKEGIYIDGFSRNPKKQAIVYDYLFFQPHEEKVNLAQYQMGTGRTVRGLFEILKSYNFTIDESTPIDQEVALDPELLGKVFEELLASYNPETASTARKATGSYYTPREVVDFMVQQSLKQYLMSHSQLPEDTLERLLAFSDDTPDLSEEQKKQIVELIDHIKILDPACGSGAFPMGILHQLVFVLQKLDPDNKLWYELQYNKALEATEEAFKHTDKDERETLLKEINESFDENINYPDYARKLYLIENCIYGVDIQPIAIQISKLRFFISLVLDQKIDASKNNYGIRPLPNLETKFVAANTLIGINVEKSHTYYTDSIKNIEKKISDLRHKYFLAKTRKDKIRYQEQDKQLREKLAQELKKLGYTHDWTQKIIALDIFDPNASADWFDPEWMFGVTDGFDIVIGNPPYISTKGIDEKMKTIFKSIYGFADDTYNHFFFKSMQILKPDGILAFISSKTFWTIQSKKNLRELLLKNTILLFFDTANPFENAMVDTCVAIVKKAPPHSEHIVLFFDGKTSFTKPQKYTFPQNDYANAPNKVFFIPTDLNKKIYYKFGKKVSNLLNTWWDKVSTSKNIDKSKKELDNYRKSLKPGDITLLGLITEGGVGIQTGNNGKYIGVLDGTKWAENVRIQRPEKLLSATEFCKKENIKNKADAQQFLNALSEQEIRQLFDNLKEKHGRDIFGQGWLYRIVNENEIANVDLLTDDEKLNGIAGTKTYVPYDKGDKDGNRWYAPTPYYIDWSRENVKVLQTDPKARWQGYQFYFREGFCWNNVLSDEKIKCRLKEKSVHSTEAMTFISLIPNLANDKYLVCLLNSTFLGNYRMDFINVSHHLTTGDAKEFPIIIPTSDQLKQFEGIFNRAYNIQKSKFEGKISEVEAENQLEVMQKELDEMVEGMYI